MADTNDSHADRVITAAPTSAEARRKLLMRLLKATGNRCYLCDVQLVVYKGRRDQPGNMATIDHIVPLSTGGGWNVENLAACCRSCNEAKAATVMPTRKKTIKKQEGSHRRAIAAFARFQTKLHCGIPLRGGWL